MLIIEEAVSRSLVSPRQAIELIEAAFCAFDAGDAMVFPVAQGRGPPDDSSFSLKSGLVRTAGAVGLKVGTYWPSNHGRHLPSHGSTVLLLDPSTGFPSALVATSYLNALRTAAADAVAVKHLARPEATTLGLLGAGHQAYFEWLAIREVRAIERVIVWSRSDDRVEALVRRLNDEGVPASRGRPDIVAKADIVVSATAAREPLIRAEWLTPGAHVSAMGADAPGKREIGRPYPDGVRLFADHPDQARLIGEFQGLDAPITPLGAVLRGRAPGRTAPDELTIFDSSGLAIQDLAVAAHVVERAVREGHGRVVDMAPGGA